MLRPLLISLVCACGAKQGTTSVAQTPPVAADKLPEAAPFVTPGEHMSYRLALGEMELATYDLAVGDVTEIAGRRAVVVQSHAKAVGLVKVVANIDDTFTSWIDVANGRPLRWIVDEFAVKGSDKERTEARMYERTGNRVPIDFHINDEPPTPEPQTVSLPDTWDYNAFLIALRGWEAPPGSTVTAEVLRSRYLWNVKLTIRGRDKVVTELGEFPALRFDGHTYKLRRDGQRLQGTDERDFSIWISDDADRVPLQTVARTDYGDIKMTIVEYTPGTGSRLRGRN
ncbi:MAG TPA: DUF3108 domain-containing protein [Kofleriaceae bacterium]